MYICEKCKQNHDGSFATGRFCSKKCSASFSTLNKRDEINNKVSKKLIGGKNPRKGYHIKTGEPILMKNCEMCENLIRIKQRFCSVSCKNSFYEMNRTAFQNYRIKASFKFNIYDYPDYFDLELSKEHGLYTAKNKGNNINGVVRDHIYSVKDGFINNVDPYLLAHPANCNIIKHIDNCKKNSKSNISLDELLQKINDFKTLT